MSGKRQHHDDIEMDNEQQPKITALENPKEEESQMSDGPGEFEDPFEDELSSEEEIVDENAMEVDGPEEGEEKEEKDGNLQVYLPGQKLEAGEVLEADSSAYVMLHQMSVNWPCLSFDIIKDGLGTNRTRFPHTVYVVSGTQADSANKNEVNVMKISNLSRTNEEESEDEEEDEVDEEPVLETCSFQHVGGVNRIRATEASSKKLAATCSDTGKVHIWDITEHYESLNSKPKSQKKSIRPLHTVASHKSEGFAMDWNASSTLLSGDMNGRIYQTSLSNSGFHSDLVPFSGHKSSVEDLQWSPVEKTVFASCSADQTVKIWDTRAKRNSSAISYQAHQSDVNVISWNHTVNYLLASGGDDGVFSVWDMRTFSSSKNITPAASFKWHSAPITSIEWHPQEDSALAVSGADDQLTIWDLSVEADPEEERVKVEGSEVPPQLLFIHQGQEDIKELHWHPQIPGCVVSTAFSGFNIFKTISA